MGRGAEENPGMSDNPLDDSDESRQQRIRERAYHLWEADGYPHGRELEFWERARELVGMEEHPHAGELPNPMSLPGADPSRPDRIEEASIQENLGEFPDRLADQGERAATPARKNRKAAA
jgi:hypothetical protein